MALPRPADIAACGGEAVALVPAPGVRSWTLDGSLVLHVPARNEVQLLDPLAAYLWTAWNEGLAPVEMAGELAESFRTRRPARTPTSGTHWVTGWRPASP